MIVGICIPVKKPKGGNWKRERKERRETKMYICGVNPDRNKAKMPCTWDPPALPCGWDRWEDIRPPEGCDRPSRVLKNKAWKSENHPHINRARATG